MWPYVVKEASNSSVFCVAVLGALFTHCRLVHSHRVPPLKTDGADTPTKCPTLRHTSWWKADTVLAVRWSVELQKDCVVVYSLTVGRNEIILEERLAHSLSPLFGDCSVLEYLLSFSSLPCPSVLPEPSSPASILYWPLHATLSLPLLLFS